MSNADYPKQFQVIEIPRFIGSSPLFFKKDFVEYNDKRIYYQEADSICIHALHKKVYVILPISVYTFNWAVVSGNEKISFSLTANKKNSKQEQIWNLLTEYTYTLIVPYIIEKMVDQIFNNNSVIHIGSVEISKQGYSRINKFLFFNMGTMTIHWSEPIHKPLCHKGTVILWKDNKGKAEQFAVIDFEIPNAFIIPELLQACYNKYIGSGKKE